MDFLKNLSLSDKDKPQPEAPPPEPAAKPEPEPEHHGDGLLSKIFGGEESKPIEPPAPAPPASEPKRSSFIDKITGHHDVDEEPPVPPPAPEKHESLVDKLSGAFKHEEEAPPPPVPAKEEKRRSFVDKLLHGDAEPTAPAVPPKEEHHLRDKLSGVFNKEEDKEAELKRREAELQRREAELKLREEAAKAKEHHSHGVFDGLKLHRDSDLPPPKGEESLLDHLGAKFGHKHDEPPPPQGLRGRVNAILGGGPQSEKNEDHLDKAIDFVQEHILKQGDQSNESAFEQMTDEQISDAIRAQYKKMTGHDFPSKDKKH